MTKTCPSCDVLAPPDARYCRHCGAPLQRLAAPNDAGGHVSPIATTVPLSGGHRTDEIVSDHAPQSAAPHTSEVTHEEMYDLWRRGTQRDSTPINNSAPARSSAHADYDPEQTQITIPVRPLTSRNLPADAAVAAASPRTAATAHAGNKPHFNGAPQQVTPSPSGALQTSPPSSPQVAPRFPAQPNEARALRVWLGMGLAVLSVVVIGCVVAALWFGARRDSGAAPPPTVAAGGEVAPVSNDPKQLLDAKLKEADALVAAGNAAEAVLRLREAAMLDPANAEPHRRLARLLLADNSRREAIEELRAVTRLAPTDAEAWRSLASAQFAEGLYRDALESYRGLGEASPAALARDTVQLAYADTLRLAGRANEARAIYRRLAETSTDTVVAAASRRQLGQPTPAPADEDAAERDAETAAAQRAEGIAAATTPRDEAASRLPEASAPTPTPRATATPLREPSGSPSDQYGRGVALWTTNRAAAIAEFRAAAGRGNSDASYYLGLSIAEGRDPRTLKRAELVAALVHFGRARRGKFRDQSVTYEEQLGRELDRRRNDER
ncbi:MAG TPA: tetratricopeptide repeat protein [Pyrinomonadaceae bacterium]|nr:tetratricopeptide repeat protein [Pyrinomonadaceae bacterium]